GVEEGAQRGGRRRWIAAQEPHPLGELAHALVVVVEQVVEVQHQDRVAGDEGERPAVGRVLALREDADESQGGAPHQLLEGAPTLVRSVEHALHDQARLLRDRAGLEPEVLGVVEEVLADDEIAQDRFAQRRAVRVDGVHVHEPSPHDLDQSQARGLPRGVCVLEVMTALGLGTEAPQGCGRATAATAASSTGARAREEREPAPARRSRTRRLTAWHGRETLARPGETRTPFAPDGLPQQGYRVLRQPLEPARDPANGFPARGSRGVRQSITLSRTPLDRRARMARLSIDTAGAAGRAHFVLPFLGLRCGRRARPPPATRGGGRGLPRVGERAGWKSDSRWRPAWAGDRNQGVSI